MFRNREAIEAKKSDFEHPSKEKERKNRRKTTTQTLDLKVALRPSGVLLVTFQPCQGAGEIPLDLVCSFFFFFFSKFFFFFQVSYFFSFSTCPPLWRVELKREGRGGVARKERGRGGGQERGKARFFFRPLRSQQD